jgi:hypothetical protein
LSEREPLADAEWSAKGCSDKEGQDREGLFEAECLEQGAEPDPEKDPKASTEGRAHHPCK